jgi:predicted acyltransferase
MSTVHAPIKTRIASLDQFRGYTVAGMLLVNFIGGYSEVGNIWKHHKTYCSYADTIMPQFFFAVGFAFRLTFVRRLKTMGVLAQAFEREIFQTLVHIALVSLWILPVIAAGTMTRVAFLVASAALHVALSHAFYFSHAWKLPVIDGGPLGFLTWSIPALVGSLACDAVTGRTDGSHPVRRLLDWSIGLMALGYGLSCLGGSLPSPPFVKPQESVPVTLWTMSQRTGSVTYQTFAAGFSLAVYALFVVLCDQANLRLGLFRTFGQNPLAAYIIHPMVAGAVKPYVPDDSPLWYVMAGFLVYFCINYMFIRYLEKNEIFLRL